MTPELRAALDTVLTRAQHYGTQEQTLDAIAPIIDAAITDHHCHCCDDRRAASMALFAAADDVEEEWGGGSVFADWLRARANEGNPA